MFFKEFPIPNCYSLLFCFLSHISVPATFSFNLNPICRPHDPQSQNWMGFCGIGLSVDNCRGLEDGFWYELQTVLLIHQTENISYFEYHIGSLDALYKCFQDG